MEILRTLRELSGLTLREVQDATGISNAYLSQLECGKIKKPSATFLYKLAKLYSVDFERLLIDAGIVEQSDKIVPVEMNPTIEHRLEALEKRVKSLEAKYGA